MKKQHHIRFNNNIQHFALGTKTNTYSKNANIMQNHQNHNRTLARNFVSGPEHSIGDLIHEYNDHQRRAQRRDSRGADQSQSLRHRDRKI
jgi:hypothetical protein